jgi:hypothetical protein
MAITRQSDLRKSNRRKSDSRKGDTKIIKIEKERGNGQEMTVRCETGTQKKAASVWSWQEEFAVDWSETFLTKKRKEHPRKGE